LILENKKNSQIYFYQPLSNVFSIVSIELSLIPILLNVCNRIRNNVFAGDKSLKINSLANEFLILISSVFESLIEMI
jgi:hypothetical protein